MKYIVCLFIVLISLICEAQKTAPRWIADRFTNMDIKFNDLIDIELNDQYIMLKMSNAIDSLARELNSQKEIEQYNTNFFNKFYVKYADKFDSFFYPPNHVIDTAAMRKLINQSTFANNDTVQVNLWKNEDFVDQHARPWREYTPSIGNSDDAQGTSIQSHQSGETQQRYPITTYDSYRHLLSDTLIDDDPMPKAERDTLPKPVCVIHTQNGCVPMVGKNFVAIGCGSYWDGWEIWKLSDWHKLSDISTAYNKAKRPRRKWCGNCKD